MKIDKLELKHIAGYLPYGLNCLTGVSPILKEDLIWKILGVVRDKGTDLGFSVKAIRHDYTNVINIWPIKPILRPLSDLTKEIQVNGEKFVPIEEYNYLRFEEISTLKGGSNAMKFIQARELELLYEMHFDIHGLIDSGLAIDINTLTT